MQIFGDTLACLVFLMHRTDDNDDDYIFAVRQCGIKIALHSLIVKHCWITAQQFLKIFIFHTGSYNTTNKECMRTQHNDKSAVQVIGLAWFRCLEYNKHKLLCIVAQISQHRRNNQHCTTKAEVLKVSYFSSCLQ